ncbi:MAG: substrate-binding domain-containing protein [Gammaproteobacteria bacterium]
MIYKWVAGLMPRQIQQINAMVQAGADAIVKVFPISPTALNSVVRMPVIKAYWSLLTMRITEPCAYNVSIDQEEATGSPQSVVEKLGGKGDIVVVTGVPGTSV